MMAMGNSTRGFVAVLVLCMVVGAQASNLKFGNEFCLLSLPFDAFFPNLVDSLVCDWRGV